MTVTTNMLDRDCCCLLLLLWRRERPPNTQTNRRPMTKTKARGENTRTFASCKAGRIRSSVALSVCKYLKLCVGCRVYGRSVFSLLNLTQTMKVSQRTSWQHCRIYVLDVSYILDHYVHGRSRRRPSARRGDAPLQYEYDLITDKFNIRPQLGTKKVQVRVRTDGSFPLRHVWIIFRATYYLVPGYQICICPCATLL